MSTPFPDLLAPENLAAARSEVISAGKKRKKKSKKAKTIIENLPNVNVSLQGGADGTSDCPIYVSDFEDASEIAVMCNYKYQDFVTKSLPVVARGRPKEREEETVEFLEETKPEEKRKGRFNMKKRIAQMSRNRSKSREPVHVDLTPLSDDPVLERELEEVTLNRGRAGLISGTPEKQAYDIENGKARLWKKVKFGKKKKKNTYDMDNFQDENDPSETRLIARKRMAIKMGVIALLVLSIVLISVGISQSKKNPKSSKPLSAAELKIHNMLLKITGEKTLTEHGTAQNQARNWLLYQDKKIEKSEAAIIQRYALACLYFATDGKKSWLKNNWLKGPECGDEKHEAWEGIDCNVDGEVRAIVLDEYGLTGSIPAEVGHLYKLENLILKNNPELTGWIPTSLSHLANLRQLGLYNNNLSGVIPDIFEHTKSLKFINLESNDIHGSIPLEIEHLSSLETLVLKNNRMEGVIPFEQLSETSIKYLGLSNNRFASTISKKIHDCEELEYLYLDNNSLRGTVPPHIGNLQKMKAMDLGNNALTGFFPGTVGNLEKLEYLSLNNNKFNRHLPLRVSLLTNLKTLNVATNTFTGTPPDFSALSNLKTLHLYENDFTGPFPESVEQLESIESLFLSSNRFTGTIPENISLMSRSLTGLYLSDNYFEGTIPTHLCEFTGLEALFMDTNKFSGPIPECFGDLTKLKQLYLFENELTGEVPASLQNLNELTGFGIEHNDIAGQVPSEVCSTVHHQGVEMWADCGGSGLDCACCSVCCANGQCNDH